MKRSTFLKTLVAVPAAIAAVSQAEPTIEQETIRAIIKRSDAAQKVLLDSFYNPQFGGYLIPKRLGTADRG